MLVGCMFVPLGFPFMYLVVERILFMYMVFMSVIPVDFFKFLNIQKRYNRTLGRNIYPFYHGVLTNSFLGNLQFRTSEGGVCIIYITS